VMGPTLSWFVNGLGCGSYGIVCEVAEIGS